MGFPCGPAGKESTYNAGDLSSIPELGVHGTLSRIDHALGHISNLGKFKKIEIISSIFSDHNYEIRNKLQEKTVLKTQHVVARQYAAKQPMGHRRKQRGNFKKCLETNEIESTMIQNQWDATKQF